jgi:pimeloyl-ACP methyl ester carboxylesterase
MRRLLRWVRLTVVALVGLLALLLAGGSAYQAIAGRVDRARHPPPGRLVDVGGRSVHIACSGTGSPTVILEAGLGDGLATWRQVQPAIARVTRVCAYDRAGYGWSDPGPKPRTGERIVADLHRALQGAGERSPFVVAGHSLGGLFLRHYAATYRGEVVGMVLVDSSHENQDPPNAPIRLLARVLQAAGVRRALFDYDDRGMNAMYLSNTTNEAINDEFAAFPASARALRAADLSLGAAPLVVLTAGSNDSDIWRRLQRDLLTRSSNSRHLIVEGSGHYIQADAPAVVIESILEVVRRARQSSPRA